jgi:hypothetical protein
MVHQVMRFTGQAARLLGAVIVMIVALLGASVAQAHPGHDHAPKPAVSAPLSTFAAAKASDEAVLQFKRTEVAEASIASKVPNGSVQPACQDLCCSLGSGTACCGSALLIGSPVRLLVPTAQMLVPIAGSAELTSIVPEALPEPPKFFA